MGLFNYATRRVLLLIPTVAGIAVFLFLVLRILPTDPAYAILGDHASQQAVEDLRRRLGLDRSILEQFVAYSRQLATGDLGTSYRTGRPVIEMIGGLLPHTVWLAVGAVLFSLVVGIPLGILSASMRNSPLDHAVRLIALAGISVPVFYLGILLLLLFSLRFPIMPLSGVGERGDLTSYLYHLTLPVVALGLTQAALIMRMTRASMLDVAKLDYVRTARAKGVAERTLVWKHIFRNAILPIVTIVGVNFGTLLAGTILTESVFNRPGLGQLLVTAIRARDYPIVQTLILMLTLMVTLINLAVDILYAFVNARIVFS